MYYNDIIKKMRFESQDEEQIIEYILKHKTKIHCIAKIAYDGEFPYTEICKYKPLTRLACILFMTEDLNKKYRDLKIPDDIFFNTIRDVWRRSIEYKKDKGTIGLSKKDVIWFRHIMGLKLFAIGELQFQIFHMIYLERDNFMYFDDAIKQELPAGAPVLNVHIPKGSKITTPQCDEAFFMARKFFDTFFYEHKWKAFLCYSWLLYPNLKNVLPIESNIIQFANRFDIISSCTYSDMAVECIFGKRFRSNKDYPQNTSLQRSVLIDKKSMGYSCGIIRRVKNVN